MSAGGFCNYAGPLAREQGLHAPPAAPSPPKAFALYNATDSEGKKIGVKFGLVECYRRASGVNPWPSDYGAPHYKYEFTVTGAGAAWIKITNDITGEFADEVSGIEMGNGSSSPSPTATVAYLTLGAWYVDGEGQIVLIGDAATGIGNQFYSYCGANHFYGVL